ncbi:cytochrome b/b6 domain-containing protein [Caulobacter sp. X]|uniref:cytochrome b/b6 domain-containing protein n=1 Tax=Caulobacter sp. X TaxID=2048901 RepID=UPI000C15A86D|nr:cytochrome b/b6 domain-containing protein [Caulobacter sp. X]PIC00513.1 Ni/Fe-hydrogenase 1 b-type cytochrome subunit [Caulobacter sp. X]
MSSDAPSIAPRQRGFKLWDAPTRLTHWALVGLIGFSWWSASTGHMDWHRWSGYSVLALITFRLIWGVVGSQSARFSQFVKGPRTVLAYARTLGDRTPSSTPGHNPVGALSVLALLAAIVTQVVTGLFSVDIDGLESGPLADRVSFETGRQFAQWHDWSFTAIQALVLAHVAAVVFYLVYKRSNLIRPMVTGRRRLDADPQLAFAPPWLALLIALVAAALTYWVMKGLRF